VAVTSGLFLTVFELVRRGRLMERYALLWLLSSLVLLVLAAWTGLLERVADLAGVAVPSNALFVVGFAFVLALLLHFSLAISRLSDETKILAQQVARLDQELEAAGSEQDERSDSHHAQQREYRTPVESQNEPERDEGRKSP
jgi:hypothetical protein